MLDFVEEALDEIAFAVECIVARALDSSVCLGRDDDVCAVLDDEIDKSITVISLVSQHILCGDAFQQRCSLRAIGDLALSEDEP